MKHWRDVQPVLAAFGRHSRAVWPSAPRWRC